MSRDEFNPTAEEVPFDNSTLTTDSLDFTGLTQSQEAISALANRNFGKQFQTNNIAGTLTTTSRTFLEIIDIDLVNVPAGEYFVLAQSIYEKTIVVGKIESMFTLDGAPPALIAHLPLPEDDFAYALPCIVLLNLTQGNHNISFQIRKSKGAGSISATRRKIIVWRVA